MTRFNKLFTTGRIKLFSLLLLACSPLLAGCDPVTTGALTFGSVFWTDIALTPVRSALGGAALSVVNSF
ncbi:MAG: hypothetical protein ACE5EQ_11420 [Phycisphaerae bacterium]